MDVLHGAMILIAIAVLEALGVAEEKTKRAIAIQNVTAVAYALLDIATTL